MRDAGKARELCAGADVLVHAAAALPIRGSKTEIMSVNVEGTATLLDAAKDADVRRVLFISSTSVYGVPRVHPISEEFPLVGVGAYGQSKIAAEGLVRAAPLEALIVPPETVLGPGPFGGFARRVALQDGVARLVRQRVEGPAPARVDAGEVERADPCRELRLVRREPRADEACRLHASRSLEPAGARLAEEGVLMLVLSAREVEQLLDLDELVDALAAAFEDVSSGKASMPPRIAALSGSGLLGVMPAYLPSSDLLDVKLVTLFQGNAGTELPTHKPPIAVFDPDPGS